MIITTTDPITGEQLKHLEFKPFVVEGAGVLAIKVYFESEATRLTYLQKQRKPHRPSAGLVTIIDRRPVVSTSLPLSP